MEILAATGLQDSHAQCESETLQITGMSLQVTDKDGETFSNGTTFKEVQFLLQRSHKQLATATRHDTIRLACADVFDQCCP